ncbi:hypothetical protein PLESTB_001143800 [Pleodorina starrii]|uniref:NAD(+) kinase n=1 Tax=Pleodorina starrii TaxID=330485 RepID=A0A9W6BRT5_9CHLO|nr:hypothetical protein PLESTM_000560800 [Pleodorina starrii]GLC56770.1 hypothetical protein PLESTB_001143800 [Pleodorina starrii]GLC66925.1 hypothetical protein PLESTF_000491000 [Pleodorina starrii]
MLRRFCLRMAVSTGAASPAYTSAAAGHVFLRQCRPLHVAHHKSVIAACQTPRQLSSMDGGSSSAGLGRSVSSAGTEFEMGIIRGASVKYNDSPALRLRRRALLKWQPGAPKKVLIVKKPKEPAASAKLQEIGSWLQARGIEVFVERVVWAAEFKEFSVFDAHTNHNDIDFCISLGGDGTVLYLTSLFEEDEPLPPMLCFAMGTLGFLTPFDACKFESTLERVLDTDSQPIYCTLRTRKRCEVVYDGRLEAVHHVLNECVLDRGAFPGAVLLEIFVDGSYVTNVEADGLIISTPSGSTAYSMSAGGPMVAPSVPCTVFTPIAPLSLSFRPVVIPESSSICVHLPTCARSHARASFDGKKPMRVRRGTSLFFTTSLCPLPIISLGPMDTDWYEGITSKLKWNQAIRQLPSCPSPVGAKEQELCSARHADRTAAEAALAAAEGCPVPEDAYLLHAAAAAAAAALPRHASTGRDMYGLGMKGPSAAAAAAMPRHASAGREMYGLGRPPHGGGAAPQSGAGGGGGAAAAAAGYATGAGANAHGLGPGTVSSNSGSTATLGSVHTTLGTAKGARKHRSGSGSGSGSGSATDTSAVNSLDDPDEAAAAFEASKASAAVTVAAAALAAASKPLQPAVMRTRSVKTQHAAAGAAAEPRRAAGAAAGGGGGGSGGRRRGRTRGGAAAVVAAAEAGTLSVHKPSVPELEPDERTRYLA